MPIWKFIWEAWWLRRQTFLLIAFILHMHLALLPNGCPSHLFFCSFHDFTENDRASGYLPLPSFHVEYCHKILCGTTAAAHLDLASQNHTNKETDKHGINTKLANGSRGYEALKFAKCITKGKDKQPIIILSRWFVDISRENTAFGVFFNIMLQFCHIQKAVCLGEYNWLFNFA